MVRMESKIKDIVENLPSWINRFKQDGYRGGQSLYFYQKVVEQRREKPLDVLLVKGGLFIERMYATLASWDMNTRSARMKDFDDFEHSLLNNKKQLSSLASFQIDTIPGEAAAGVKRSLGDLYDELELMKSGGRLVANSKALHFLLPNLVMPMDRNNILRFFFNNTTESKNKFLKIFDCTCEVAKRVDLKSYFDHRWNLTITKVIDNAIIGSGMK